MHILGIVILIWIIRYFASNGANGGPSTANDPPSKWYLVIFLIAYFFSSVMLGIAGDLHPVVTAIGLIFFSNLLLSIMVCANHHPLGLGKNKLLVGANGVGHSLSRSF